MPQQGETRTAHGETRTWNGSGWELAPSGVTDQRGFPMIQMPPSTPSTGSDANDAEVLKQFLTTGGTIAGGLLGGPPGAIAGGAAGRMLGHVPEALLTHTTGKPSDSSFLGDGALGAGEGAIQEAVPMVAGPAMKYGGKVLGAIGRGTGSGGAYAPMIRALLGERMGNAIAGPVGSAVGGATAAALPPVMEATGGALERAGGSFGSDPLSTRTKSALDYFMRAPDPTKDELLSAGAEKYATAKGAQASQDQSLADRWSPTNYDSKITRTAVTPADDIFGNYEEPADEYRLFQEAKAAGFGDAGASRASGYPRPLATQQKFTGPLDALMNSPSFRKLAK